MTTTKLVTLLSCGHYFFFLSFPNWQSNRIILLTLHNDTYGYICFIVPSKHVYQKVRNSVSYGHFLSSKWQSNNYPTACSQQRKYFKNYRTSQFSQMHHVATTIIIFTRLIFEKHTNPTGVNKSMEK